jgi:molybdopterin/thiamine biosynthesis adenylyltransferase
MSESSRDSRQILALGKEGQEKIRKIKAGIVGLGGLGSHIAQQVAYLGVRSFVLVDPDSVGKENLNRIVGSTPGDLGKSKVEVAHRMITGIAGTELVDIYTFKTDLRNREALTRLSGCDVIFGCIDRDGPRLILNELAMTNDIPYFDSAFGITVEAGKIVEAGGRVVLVSQEGPCLLCCKEIDRAEAAYDLANETEKKVALERGYVSGAEVQQPSIVSLDGIIASVAATEFLALVTGFRQPVQYSCYDMLRGELRPLSNRVLDGCMHHVFGKGNAQDIFRYCT